MTRVLTDADLAAWGACDEAREAMRAAYPDGMPITPETLAQVAAHPSGPEWLSWLVGSPLVTALALAEYKRVAAPARAEYERVTAPALAEYKRVRDSAWAEYERVTALALAEYKRVAAPAAVAAILASVEVSK